MGTAPLPFAVSRLVELDLDAAGHFEVSDQAVTVIGDAVQELDTALFEVLYSLLNIIAVERNIMRPGWRAFFRIGRVTPHFGFRQVKDEPAAANVGRRQLQFIAEK